MKVIAILSGGLDSTTMIYKLLAEGNDVKCISYDYNQKHKKELEMAKKTCEKLGLEHRIIDLSSINKLISNSALTSDIDVPHGHYEDDNMKKTVVPGRNLIMASIAGAYASNENYDAIALGVHSGDHAIYPDCRPEFIDALQNVLEVFDYNKIKVLTPFLNNDKIEIVKQGIELGVDYSLTWTCYEGGEKPCGQCGSCVERAEAFEKNNINDPLV